MADLSRNQIASTVYFVVGRGTECGASSSYKLSHAGVASSGYSLGTMQLDLGQRGTMAVSELEWRVMPALVLDQAKLYMRDNAPVAYVSWARMSNDVAQRYQQTPHHLSASDWKSGEQVWLVDLCTPFGGVQEVMKDLRESVFAGLEIHQLTLNGEGQVKNMTWPAVDKNV